MTVSYLSECVTYDPFSGLFHWKARPPHHFKPGRYGQSVVCDAWNKKYAGRQAFNHPDGRGYLFGSINSKHYAAHRAAFALIKGEWPEWTVDHINGDRLDNSAPNLREATPAQQVQNAVFKRSNHRGVSYHKRNKKWIASIRVHLGYFDTLEDASAAYEKAAREVHGRFYILNGVRPAPSAIHE